MRASHALTAHPHCTPSLHRDEYMRWVLDDVAGALRRFKELKNGRPDLMVTRMEVRNGGRLDGMCHHMNAR